MLLQMMMRRKVRERLPVQRWRLWRSRQLMAHKCMYSLMSKQVLNIEMWQF